MGFQKVETISFDLTHVDKRHFSEYDHLKIYLVACSTMYSVGLFGSMSLLFILIFISLETELTTCPASACRTVTLFGTCACNK